MRETLYLDEVGNDIAEAMRWYAGQQQDLDTRFVAAVKETVANIVRMPLSYAERHKNVRIAHTRDFPYNVHFYVDEEKEQIVIIGVVHGKRNDALLLDRQPFFPV
jgi:plasmid stabilization system protein ParE